MNTLGTNSYKIIHGDAIEALKNEIEDNSVDLIFADPPYNIGKNFAGCKDKWQTDDQYLTWCYQWVTTQVSCVLIISIICHAERSRSISSMYMRGRRSFGKLRMTDS